MPHNFSSSSVNGFTVASETKFKQHWAVIWRLEMMSCKKTQRINIKIPKDEKGYTQVQRTASVRTECWETVGATNHAGVEVVWKQHTLSCSEFIGTRNVGRGASETSLGCCVRARQVAERKPFMQDLTYSRHSITACQIRIAPLRFALGNLWDLLSFPPPLSVHRF